jgi:hypothetical protein
VAHDCGIQLDMLAVTSPPNSLVLDLIRTKEVAQAKLVEAIEKA